MTSPQHTRRIVLKAALEACPALPTASGRSHRAWGPLVRRMQALAKPDAAGAKRLARFGAVIGDKLDRPSDVLNAIDGEWIVLLSKVLDAVVSPKTKQERLNCATCAPEDFPVLLAVIQAVAYGAPDRMWRPRNVEWCLPVSVGLPGPDGPPPSRRNDTPESHRRIADKTWYRPQLAMLVTSIWPKDLGLEYYESTLRHILHPGVNVDTEAPDILSGEAPGFEELGGLI